jgi:hypothetical protein
LCLVKPAAWLDPEPNLCVIFLSVESGCHGWRTSFNQVLLLLVLLLVLVLLLLVVLVLVVQMVLHNTTCE